MNISSEANSTKEKGYFFRLFVAGNEPHSKAAKENLEKLCKSRFDERCEIEIVDVFQSFQTALENNVFLTPALMMVSPKPAVTVYGDLSDTGELIKALGLGESR